MKTIAFIVNPIAGTKLRQISKDLVYSIFQQEKEITIIYKETAYAGHGIEIAEELIQQGVNAIIVAGGDGSINEIAPLLVNTNIHFGIIPVGSGNGLANHLELPLNVRKAIEVIRNNKIQAIDCGRIQNQQIGSRFFFSNCGFGYDAEVIHAYSEVKWRGFLTYFIFLVKSMITLQPKRVKISFNGLEETIAPFVTTIANSSKYGYSIDVAPDASVTDGLLDIFMIKKKRFLNIFKFAILSLTKKTHYSNVAEFHQVEQLTIHFAKKTKFQIDGEPFHLEGKTEIEVVKGALKTYIV